MKANIFRIQGNDSVQCVQDHFKGLFPSMQISFFCDPEKLKQKNQSIMFSPNMKIDGIHPMERDLTIEITPTMRVTDLENIINSRGLHVQISCRIANRSLPDTSVSKWFLKDVYNVDVPHISTIIK